MTTASKERQSHKKSQISAKKMTAKAKQTAFLTAFVEKRFNISAACRQVGIDRRTFYRWRKSSSFSQALEDAIQERIDQAESALFRNIQAGDTTSIIFFLKTIGKSRGYIEAEKVKTGEAPAKKAVEIMDKLLSGQIDVTAAALTFTREGIVLPEALKLLLSKTTPPDPPLELPTEISEEELERKYLEGLQRAQHQEEVFVPARRAEIQKLKDELRDADSFDPDAAIKTQKGVTT